MAILILHGVAVALLFAEKHELQRAPEKSEPLQITLLPRSENLRAPESSNFQPSFLSPRNFENGPQVPLTLPNIALPDSPSSNTAAQTVLRDYLGCHLKEASGLSTEEKQRCEKLLRLPVPEGPQKQTEEEARLARMFDHERARMEGAIRVPCISATMLDVMCLLNLATHGSDTFMDTYATAGAKGLNSNSGGTSLGIRPGGGKPKK